MKSNDSNQSKPFQLMKLGRRSFLMLSGGVATGILIGSAGCGSEGPAGEPDGGADDGDGGGSGDVDRRKSAGLVSDYGIGSVERFTDGKFFVLRDAAGLYAMSAVCTHQQCTLNPGIGELPCPCHGSMFDLDGNVVAGPAESALVHYRLDVEGEDVLVDTGEIVSASERTPV